jgi:quercetin dioxygenase-like cupin family protein
MATLTRMSLDAPQETRSFERGKLELVNVESGPVGRATFEPGWRWSEHVKPIAGTESCEAAHLGYFVSGRMKVVMDDGQEMEFGPSDFAVIPPGHDAWIVGDQPCVVIDWQGYADYAKRLRRPGASGPAQGAVSAQRRVSAYPIIQGFNGRWLPAP